MVNIEPSLFVRKLISKVKEMNGKLKIRDPSSKIKTKIKAKIPTIYTKTNHRKSFDFNSKVLIILNCDYDSKILNKQIN